MRELAYMLLFVSLLDVGCAELGVRHAGSGPVTAKEKGGFEVRGRVLDVEGNPVAGLMVEIIYGNWKGRRATETDEGGHFAIRGLGENHATVIAHAMDLGQQCVKKLRVDRDITELTLRMSRKPRPEVASTELLGMKLATLNRELRAHYHWWPGTGVVVLDPGKRIERLGIGPVREGYVFWIAGHERVETVEEWAWEVFKIVSSQRPRKDGTYTCRVVYNFRVTELHGTNTQFMVLTSADFKELLVFLTQRGLWPRHRRR